MGGGEGGGIQEGNEGGSGRGRGRRRGEKRGKIGFRKEKKKKLYSLPMGVTLPLTFSRDFIPDTKESSK